MIRKLGIISVRATLVSVGLAASVLFVPAVAHADEINHGSEGVLVTVEITPRACVTDCAGGGSGGSIPGAGLPATGVEFSAVVLWSAVALVVLGLLLFVQRQRVSAIAGSLRIPTRRDSTMASEVIASHTRPTNNRGTTTGGSREKDDPDIE